MYLPPQEQTLRHTPHTPKLQVSRANNRSPGIWKLGSYRIAHQSMRRIQTSSSASCANTAGNNPTAGVQDNARASRDNSHEARLLAWRERQAAERNANSLVGNRTTPTPQLNAQTPLLSTSNISSWQVDRTRRRKEWNGMELPGETWKQIDEGRLLTTAPVAFYCNWDIYLASRGSG
jgi:hypothetical protein